jgi:hypothetical protein
VPIFAAILVNPRNLLVGNSRHSVFLVSQGMILVVILCFAPPVWTGGVGVVSCAAVKKSCHWYELSAWPSGHTRFIGSFHSFARSTPMAITSEFQARALCALTEGSRTNIYLGVSREPATGGEPASVNF